MGFVIKELFAFVTTDNNDGDEGIMGFDTGRGMMPMIGADMARVDSLRKTADLVAVAAGISYEVKHFHNAAEAVAALDALSTSVAMNPNIPQLAATNYYNILRRVIRMLGGEE